MQELLFHDATVVTMDRNRAILEHASVAVRDQRIVDLSTEPRTETSNGNQQRHPDGKEHRHR